MKYRLPTLGHVLIGLVALVLVLAGILKLVNVGAEDMIEGLKKAHLDQHQTLISIIALLCGTSLFVPFTRRFGYLLASAYWGGAIVAHLTYDDSVAMPASFMVLLCVGIALVECSPTSED